MVDQDVVLMLMWSNKEVQGRRIGCEKSKQKREAAKATSADWDSMLSRMHFSEEVFEAVQYP